MKKNELYSRVLEKYGVTSQTLMVAEECAELVKACSKLARHDQHFVTNRENLIEEIADVRIMCEQMIWLYNINEERIESYKEQKLKRLAERLGETYESD